MVKQTLALCVGAFLLAMAGCVTAPPKPAAPPLIQPPSVTLSRYSSLIRLDPKDYPAFQDDLDTTSLHTAALQSMAYYQRMPDNQLFVLGADTYTARDLADSMAKVVTLLETTPQPKDWFSILVDSFTVYQSTGVDPERSVVFSSYYEPTISVRAAKDTVYKFPLYARPADLVDVDLSLFDPAYQGVRIVGRHDGRTLVPYPTREDIDGKKILKDQGLEIAWAKDPFDVLDLQIEGSGWLDFGKGVIYRVRYDGDNGRRYKSVGQDAVIATGRIPAHKFNRHTFRQYLATHPEERQSVLNVNERYIFFRIDTSSASVYAYGNIDVPLTAGRSIATDPKLFPKGALAWIDTTQSVVNASDRVKGTKPLKRFMLNQDEGGAIQGPGRVDIFAGHGASSKMFATHLWYKGKLYFLVKKKS